MTLEPDFDAIVIGAGVAGICCAGEMVVQGMRPLLIAETKEVAYNLRSEWIGGNRVLMQAAVFSPVWSGGWWRPLAQALNASVGPVTGQLPISASLWGTGQVSYLHQWYLSPSSAFDALQALSPIPLDEHRVELERLLSAGLAIPFDELSEMHDVMWSDWLELQGASEFATYFFNYLASLVTVVPMDLVRHVTVFGALAYIRGILLGECYYPEAYPDYREGVFIPMAQAVERNGGTVWRGRKVARVETDGGRVGAVCLQDGTVVRAPVVAVATGNPRIPVILDPVPPEVERMVDFEWGEHSYLGYCSISLLNQEVLPKDFQHFFGVVSAAPEWTQWMWPGHVRAPWGVEPGKQILFSGSWLPRRTVEEMGGPDVLYKRMREVEESYFPGFQSAIEERRTIERAGVWYSQVLAGDKLERRSESVEGLWYVGDGSRPVKGLWTEAAASAGILGARAIAEEFNKNR